MIRSLHVITASTSGNTEYVVDTLTQWIASHAPEVSIRKQRAEQAEPADLLDGDLLIFGSGTWNTGGNEGQLNPHMHALLMDRAKDLDLAKKPVTFISLGDDRYYFRTRCTEHFLRFQREHAGLLFMPPLIIVNEPYAQEEKIQHWAEKLLERMRAEK